MGPGEGWGSGRWWGQGAARESSEAGQETMSFSSISCLQGVSEAETLHVFLFTQYISVGSLRVAPIVGLLCLKERLPRFPRVRIRVLFTIHHAQCQLIHSGSVAGGHLMILRE